MKVTFDWAQNMVNTRCFGWGIPHCLLSPMIDQFNHCDNLQTQADLFHTKLHLADNKIYKHKHDFEICVENFKAKNDDRMVDESK